MRREDKKTVILKPYDKIYGVQIPPCGALQRGSMGSDVRFDEGAHRQFADPGGDIPAAVRQDVYKRQGKEQKIRIEASSGLTEQEIQRMRDEAKANEAKDKEEKERIDKINAADSNIFATEKQLKEYGDKLPADKMCIRDSAGIRPGVERLADRLHGARMDGRTAEPLSLIHI